MGNARYGLYRAVVRNNDDPERRCRLQVEVPALDDGLLLWAAACVPAGGFDIPEIGTEVWVVFEAGDRNRPVWVGVEPGWARDGATPDH